MQHLRAKGSKVEAMQTDEALYGSWFEAEVLGHTFPDKIYLRYAEINAGLRLSARLAYTLSARFRLMTAGTLL